MTMDDGCRAMTVAVLVVLVVVLGPLWFYSFAFPGARGLHVGAVATTSLVVLSALAAWAMSPIAAELTGEGLLIHRRRFPPKRFVTADIVGIEEAPQRLGLRAAGVGGFFGCFGLYWVGELGFYWLYTARLKASAGALLRRREGKPLVVIPDDGAAFVEACRAWLRG